MAAEDDVNCEVRQTPPGIIGKTCRCRGCDLSDTPVLDVESTVAHSIVQNIDARKVIPRTRKPAYEIYVSIDNGGA